MIFDRDNRTQPVLDAEDEDSSMRSVGDEEPSVAESSNAVAILAYAYWQERGCPHGSDKEDWFRAEQELASKGPSRE